MHRKGLGIISLSVFLSILPSVSIAAEFKDTTTHWAKPYIEYFHDKKIVSGMGNNSFNPEQSITMESFLNTLYNNINTSEPFLLYPAKEQDSGTESTESASESKTETSTESSTVTLDSTTDAELKEMQEQDSLKQKENSTPQEDTVDTKLSNNISSNNSEKETSTDPIGYVPPTAELTIPFQNSSIQPIVTKLYEHGLLQSFTLNDKFMSSPLNRQRVVLICKNYDILRQSHNLNSDRTSKILEKNNWIDSNNEELISPNQVLTRGEAMKIMYELFYEEELPQNYKVELNVPHISQMTPVSAPVGCEPVSLLMCLRSKGYCKDISIRSYLDHVPRHKNDPEIAFAGSPYVPNAKLRTTIFPKPLTEYGKSYGADVVDLTEKNTEELMQELYQGHPVVAYVTLYWRKPYYRNYQINGTTRTYLRNNHALVLAGYDPTTKKYLVVDPYNVRGIKSRYWVAETTFKPLYEVRKHAVCVK